MEERVIFYVVSQITEHSRINFEGSTDYQVCVLSAVTSVFSEKLLSARQKNLK